MNLQLYIDALNNRQYQQSLYYIHPSDNIFCAVGLLCETFRLVTGQGSWKLHTYSSHPLPAHYSWVDPVEKFTIQSVEQWIWQDATPGIRLNIPHLVVLNDKFGLTFPQIASLLLERRTPQLYF